MAQTPRRPDVDEQRAAMKKLGFLVGEWSGEASVLRGPGQFVELAQTESAQFKLDGLVLMIEGVGRAKADGRVQRALAPRATVRFFRGDREAVRRQSVALALRLLLLSATP